MIKIHQITILIAVLLLVSVASIANAESSLYELKAWEKERISKEMGKRFTATDDGAFQKLNKNPWSSKRVKQKQHESKIFKLSNSLDSCRTYSLKQRKQCFARGGDVVACDSYYKERINICGELF